MIAGAPSRRYNLAVTDPSFDATISILLRRLGGKIMPIGVLLLLVVVLTGRAAAAETHNVILFVADGMRAGMATREHAPAMSKLRAEGVTFAKSHAIFPTFTTLNASVMATGHLPGDTGDFSNTIYTGYPVASAKNTVTPFLENDSVLADVDEHFSGDYLNEDTILKLARGKGLSTAAVGKLGPTLIFDHTREGRERTIVIDDVTGSQGGIPLSEEIKEALAQAGIEAKAPSRGENGKAGDANTPGTNVANVVQQEYFVKVLTDAILPMFKKREKAFLIVFWSRDRGPGLPVGAAFFAAFSGLRTLLLTTHCPCDV